MCTSSLLRFEAMCRPWTGCANVGVALCGGRYAEGAGRAGTSKVVAFVGLGAMYGPQTRAGVAHSGGTECTAQHGYFRSATPWLLWAGGRFSVTTGAVSTTRTLHLVGLSALGAAGSVDAIAHLIVALVVSGIGAVTLLTAGCVLSQGC
eukprot:COSAG01_NODE_2294_length_7967_cov_41.570539_9_plen_149_part_00